MHSEDTTLFVNTTSGNVGVIKLARNGDRDPIAVGPHERVELTLEEQELTANAPRLAENSPFVKKPYTDHDPTTGDVIAEGERAMLEEVVEEREVPGKKAEADAETAPAEPEEDAAPKGVRDEKEVVGA